MYPGLPEYCYTVHLPTNDVIMVKRGEIGFYKAFEATRKGQEQADALNKAIGVTKPQEYAMAAGSMFGWGIPAADPSTYNEDGTLKE